MDSQHSDANRTSRFWCFTLNNPMGQFIALPEGFRYLISGIENAGTTGTRHLQCYAELTRSHNRKWLSNRINGAGGISIRYENSSGLACVQYCKKGDQSHDEWEDLGIDGPAYGLNASVFEIGDLDKVDQPKGKRNDLDQLCTTLMSGATLKQVAVANPSTYVRNYRGIANFRNLLGDLKPLNRNFRVTLVFGKTRFGKSYWVREMNPDVFVKPIGKGLWFDDYAQQDVVLIDEFRGQYPMSDMLQILDCYPISVETKGGHVRYQPDHVFLTTNMHVYRMYADHDQDTRDAFFARFHEVVWFYENRKYRILEIDEMRAFFDDPNWNIDTGREYMPRPAIIPATSTDARQFGFDFPSQQVVTANGGIVQAVNFEHSIVHKTPKKRRVVEEPILHPVFHAQSEKRKGIQKIRKFMNERGKTGLSPPINIDVNTGEIIPVVVDKSSTGNELLVIRDSDMSETESVSEYHDSQEHSRYTPLDLTDAQKVVVELQNAIEEDERLAFRRKVVIVEISHEGGDIFEGQNCPCCNHVAGTEEWANVHRLDGLR